jgi:quinol monooxygenase YgiN
MIHVVAILTAHPGKRAELIAAFADNVPNVLAEDGCVQYTGVVDAEGFGRAATPIGADAFAVIEKWASPEALKAHGAAAHMVAFGAKVKNLLANRVIHILSEV